VAAKRFWLGLGGLLLIGLGGSILFVVAMLLTIAWDRLLRCV
jgi:hypothetical protein